MDITSKAYSTTVDFIKALIEFPIYFLCLYFAILIYAPDNFNWVAYIFLAIFTGSCIQFCWNKVKILFNQREYSKRLEEKVKKDFKNLNRVCRKTLAYSILAKKYSLHSSINEEHLRITVYSELSLFRFCRMTSSIARFDTEEYNIVRELFFEELHSEFLEELKKEHSKDFKYI